MLKVSLLIAAAGLFTTALATGLAGTTHIASLPADSTRSETSAQSSGAGGGNALIAVQHTLTLEGANRAIAGAIAKANERHAGGAIAVVDAGGNVIAFQRLDGTFPAGAAVSIGKARTAATFKKPTKAFEDSINGGRIALSAVHDMTPLQGGVPIMHDGFVVGGIGVSGAHSQAEDEELALAGAAAVESSPAISTPTH